MLEGLYYPKNLGRHPVSRQGVFKTGLFVGFRVIFFTDRFWGRGSGNWYISHSFWHRNIVHHLKCLYWKVLNILSLIFYFPVKIGSPEVKRSLNLGQIVIFGTPWKMYQKGTKTGQWDTEWVFRGATYLDKHMQVKLCWILAKFCLWAKTKVTGHFFHAFRLYSELISYHKDT